MEETLPLEEKSIYQIYIGSQESTTYMIPVYQRNYAWKEDEIKNLINDVFDSFNKNPETPYYIGTLVTYKRGDNVCEVIDGQQRLTTIYIILKALGIKDIKNKLTYGARKVSASTIERLDSYPNLGDNVDLDIRNGFKIAQNVLDDIVESRLNSFKTFFLENVHLIHYNVPKDVDLNHYFEVMNSRGEQLEKHEIVKSMLSQYLKENDMATFCRIWEACSEMNVYIQQVFSDSNVFGNNLHKFYIDSFNEIPKQDKTEGKDSIKNLLECSMNKFEETTNSEQNDKFQPIVDFPNFLLIVLKITMMEYEDFNPVNFTLDDKELIHEFDNALDFFDDDDERIEFTKDFAFNLLKAKFLLDNYVVHHSLNQKELYGDNPWKLQPYSRQTQKKKEPKNLIIKREIVHILSMFEVSFTPKQRKNYLFYCLLYLFSDYEPNDSDYLAFLQSLADKYFYDVYLNPDSLNTKNQPIPNAFDNALLKDGELNVDDIGEEEVNYREKFVEIYKQGRADIPLFVFNYMDYKLWRKYAYSMRGNKAKKGSTSRVNFFEELGCSDFDLEAFNNFYFSRTRKSLEHFYPQAKAGDGKALSSEDINCFGNFAMIGEEVNSSGSNLNPKAKLDRYSDSKSDPVSVASLKFKIMMQKCKDNQKEMIIENLDRDADMEWDVEDMQTHQEKMLNILFDEYE